MPLWDISVPVHPRMITFAGDPAVRIERVLSMAEGGVCNLSKIDSGLHSGTHIDAPLHFIDGAAGVEATPLEALLGPVWVADATAAEAHLTAADIDALGLPAGVERLLFKTRNGALWERGEFSEAFIALTEAAARSLAARGVRLVGIDYLSVAPYGDPAPVHVALLEAGVVILEGLDLRAVAPGAYRLACLPVLIPGADGAPARAVLLRD